MFAKVLYEYLLSCSDLTKHLTQYSGKPAIFNSKVPDDMDDTAWKDKTQYGRAVFYINMQADTERKISGMLEIDIQMCGGDTEKPAEIVKSYVDGYFFTSETETIFVKWSATKRFTNPEKKVSTAAVICTLIAFPNQTTKEPDPIRLVNEWTRSLLPDVKLIGFDKDLPTVWKPTEKSPAVYWRLSKTYPCERIPSMYAGNWYTAQMHAHIFTTDIAIANTLAEVMCQELDMKKVLKFSDGTNMRIDNNNQVYPGSDELRVGQLSVEGDYCVLRKKPETDTLKKIILNRKIKISE